MSNPVLVPLVYSRQNGTTAAALEVAKTLAAASESDIVLLHVVEDLPPSFEMTKLPSEILETALANAAEGLERISAEYELLESTNIVVRRGYASRTILDVAEETGCKLIVLPSHDPGPSDYLLGTVASRVIRHAHCSVYVARDTDQ